MFTCVCCIVYTLYTFVTCAVLKSGRRLQIGKTRIMNYLHQIWLSLDSRYSGAAKVSAGPRDCCLTPENFLMAFFFKFLGITLILPLLKSAARGGPLPSPPPCYATEQVAGRQFHFLRIFDFIIAPLAFPRLCILVTKSRSVQTKIKNSIFDADNVLCI